MSRKQGANGLLWSREKLEEKVSLDNKIIHKGPSRVVTKDIYIQPGSRKKVDRTPFDLIWESVRNDASIWVICIFK